MREVYNFSGSSNMQVFRNSVSYGYRTCDIWSRASRKEAPPPGMPGERQERGGVSSKKQKGNSSCNLREPTLQGLGAVVGHWQSCPLRDWQSSERGSLRELSKLHKELRFLTGATPLTCSSILIFNLGSRQHLASCEARRR